MDGVAAATPLYYGRIDWKQPDGTIRTLDTFGIDPAGRAFRTPAIAARLPEISISDVALIDSRTRNVPPGLFKAIADGRPHVFEVKGPHPHRGRHRCDRRRFRRGRSFGRLRPDLPQALSAARFRRPQPYPRDAGARPQRGGGGAAPRRRPPRLRQRRADGGRDRGEGPALPDHAEADRPRLRFRRRDRRAGRRDHRLPGALDRRGRPPPRVRDLQGDRFIRKASSCRSSSRRRSSSRCWASYRASSSRRPCTP